MYRRWPEIWTRGPREAAVANWPHETCQRCGKLTPWAIEHRCEPPKPPFWTEDRQETAKMIASMIVFVPLMLLGYLLALGLMFSLVAVFVFGLQALGGS